MARKKAVEIKDLLKKVVRNNRFEQRVHDGHLASLWNEIFEGECGELLSRDGDMLLIKVRSSVLKYELENFKKEDLLQVLHQHDEFKSIQRLKFTETRI